MKDKPGEKHAGTQNIENKQGFSQSPGFYWAADKGRIDMGMGARAVKIGEVTLKTGRIREKIRENTR